MKDGVLRFIAAFLALKQRCKNLQPFKFFTLTPCEKYLFIFQ